ncbi:MAG TPA: hypothetical protein VD887_06575 [Allosphingosinicella sp.]|nr:hypothetical protein [Allosphingosinicella sp.]
MSQRRRDAFLKALRETGNQKPAAERACVSPSWVLKERKANPPFDADCRAAIEAAKAELRDAGSNAPPTGWGHLDGVELVVRGGGGRGGRRVLIARARTRQITPRVEQRLLQVLGATCTGDAACRAAGVSKSAVWNHRQRWAAFDAKWSGTVVRAHERLECGLLRNAQNLFSATEAPPDRPMPPMTFAQVVHLLHMHKHAALGLGKAPGVRWRPPPTLAELAPGIWRKLQAFERDRTRGEEEIGRDEAEWAERRDSLSDCPPTGTAAGTVR